jgi:hypothetical protein
LPKFDGGSGRYGRGGSRCQIACDLVNLRGREAVLFALLAATGKKREKEANSQQRKLSCTIFFAQRRMMVWVNRVRLPGHEN